MATIQRVYGKYDSAKSQSGSIWVILADEQNIFEVPEWIPQTIEVSGKLTPPTPSDIETPKTVTWTLMDMSKKEILHIYKSNTLEKLPITINKQYSGVYSYFLEAVLDATKEKAGIYVRGYTSPTIISADWSSQPNMNLKKELKQGENVYIHIETEGMNGEKFKLEVYDDEEKKVVKELDAECINGIIVTQFNTIGFVPFKLNIAPGKGMKPGKVTTNEKDTKKFYIKIKTLSGKYLSGKSFTSELMPFSVNGKIEMSVNLPINNTATKVGEPDKSTVTTGFISFEKIAVNSKYDVCNDEVASFSDYKNFWILEDAGKYYHWLKKRTNSDDINKPSPLPITLDSQTPFSFTAVFKTIFPIDATIRVRDKDKQYTFAPANYPKSVAKGKEHEITFVSQNTPYKGTVQYFPNFELIFDYSLDGISWTPLGSAQFCLYLTWKKSLFSLFDTTSTETMQIKCNHNNKENICETLLWLGCKKGNFGNISNEELLIDKIFDEFKSLKIIRRRENKWLTEGLGYWRNASSSSGSFVRGLRSLLRDGEARCGEWTDFFQHILLTQGLPVGSDTIGICTELAYSQYGFNTYIEKSSKYKAKPISYQFAVKNAMHNDVNNFNSTVGDSPGQGTSQSQPTFIDHYWFYYTKGKRFYDASYGKTYSSSESNLNKYCKDNLNSMFLFDGITGNTPSKPFTIEKTDLHNYIKATKDLFS